MGISNPLTDELIKEIIRFQSLSDAKKAFTYGQLREMSVIELECILEKINLRR